MKTTKTGEMTVDDIVAAIKFWLEHRKGIEVEGEIYFRIEGKEDPDDWQARLPLTYVLEGATFTVKQ